MKRILQISLIITSFFFSFSTRAQFPGGVSSNLRGWYIGSTGVTVASGVVTNWNDQSGNGFHATQTSATSRPVQTSAAINYNTAITFDGLDNFMNIPDLVNSAATGVSAYAVARQIATNRDALGCVLVGQTNVMTGNGGGYGLVPLSPANTVYGCFVRDYDTNNAFYVTSLASPAVMTGIWNGTTANNLEYFQDGISRDTDPYTPGSVGDGGGSYLGGGVGSGTDYCFYGDIPEVIVYTGGQNAATKVRIETYLGIKYGVTLGNDYVNASATATLYSPVSPYGNNIIGIGREDANSMNQKQSHQYNDTVRVYISTLAASNSANAGSFAANNSYVVMGSNTGRLSAILTEKPGSVFSRLEREWKVTNTNFGSTFNWEVKLNSIAKLSSVTASHLRLLVDNDGNFTDATVYSTADGLTFTYANPLITVTGINTTMIPSGSTRFITIASINAGTPLPLKLIKFDATRQGEVVTLDWTTASGDHGCYFEIEKSYDGIDFQPLGIVNCKEGGESAPAKYGFCDGQFFEGVSYYRLKQVDVDGGEYHSSIVTVQTFHRSVLCLFPNPNKGVFTIDLGITMQGEVPAVELRNAHGALIQLKIYRNGSLIEVYASDELRPGIYFCVIYWRNREDRLKVVIEK